MNRQAVLLQYRKQLEQLFQNISVSIHAINAPDVFLQRLDSMLDTSGLRKNLEKRNPGRDLPPVYRLHAGKDKEHREEKYAQQFCL